MLVTDTLSVHGESVPFRPEPSGRRQDESVTTKRTREQKSFVIKNKVAFFYLSMLVGHVGHIFEETWGRFFLIDAVFGLGWFLVANWLLFCIPVVFFYFVLNDKPWAYYMSMVYAGIMILNGFAHTVAIVATGRYFNGFAGGCTGIGLLLIGPPMIYYLRTGMPNK